MVPSLLPRLGSASGPCPSPRRGSTLEHMPPIQPPNAAEAPPPAWPHPQGVQTPPNTCLPSVSLLSTQSAGWVAGAWRLTATRQVGRPRELRLHLPASCAPPGRVRKRSGQVLGVTQPCPSVDREELPTGGSGPPPRPPLARSSC
jgi:hypothetical protein